MDITPESPADNAQDEISIEQAFARLVALPPDKRIDFIRRLKDSLPVGLDLVALKAQHSVGVYFACSSRAGLSSLVRLNAKGDLRTLLERLFAFLLGRDVVRIKKVVWKLSEFMRCYRSFNQVTGKIAICNALQLVPIGKMGLSIIKVR